MKTCRKCNTELPEIEFNKKGGKRNGHQTICKKCWAAYINQWYKHNKATHVERVNRRKDQVRASLSALKESTPCRDCGVLYPPYVMQFDHLSNKRFNLSEASRHGAKQVEAEVAKCEIVCANCHAIRTHKRSLAG